MNRTTTTKFDIREEFKVVPGWAKGLAVLFFVGIEALLFLVAFRHDHNPPPLPLRILVGCLAGPVLAFVALLIGYVNADSRRRGMNHVLWTILVIFIPNAIGYIIYFIVRQPVKGVCPQCDTAVDEQFNFCPKCKFNLHPACPQCHRSIVSGSLYCPYCSAELKA